MSEITLTIGTDCGPGAHSFVIACAKLRVLRDGAAIASQEVVELNQSTCAN